MRILIQNIIEPLQSYLKRKRMLVILKEKWIPQRTKLNLKEIVSCLEKNLLLLSAFHLKPLFTLLWNNIIPCVVIVIICIATVLLNGITLLTFWRSSPLRKNVCYFLVMLQSFFDFARFRFLPLTIYIYILYVYCIL